MDNNNCNIIYHYCSTNTFMKIIKKKAIRLSNIFKMNDPLEINHILDDLYEQVLNSYKKNYSYEFKLCNFQYDDKTGKSALSKLVSDIKEEIKKNEYISYIACFSDSSKNDNLGQWRAYGDDGYGVAVGFDKKILHDIVGQVKEKKLNFFIFDMAKIIYSPDKELDFIKSEIVNSIFRSLKSAYGNENYKKGNCTYRTSVLAYVLPEISAILNAAIKYKIGYFKDEDEWRLYLTTFINGIYSESCSNFNKDIICGDYIFRKQRFRNDNNKLISYIDFCFGKINISSNIIRQIVIGPKSRIDKDDSDLKMFLKTNGFNVQNIIASEVKLNI